MSPKPAKHSTTDFLVVFGPRVTYLVQAPGVELISTLSVSSELQDILNSSKEVNFVLYPSLPDEIVDDKGIIVNGSVSTALPDPCVAYIKKKLLGESKFYAPAEDHNQSDSISELKEWLGHRWGNGLYVSTDQGIQVVSNNKGSWWGLSKAGNMSFKSLPSDVRQLVKPAHPNGKIKHMALGTQGAYVVVFEDGHVIWDLKGAYDRLDAQLEGKLNGEVLYVSLSPYRAGIYFAAFTDATILYDFPQDVDGSSIWKDLDNKFLEFDGLRVLTPSDTLKSSSETVKKPSVIRQFTGEVLNDVAKHDAESLLE